MRRSLRSCALDVQPLRAMQPDGLLSGGSAPRDADGAQGHSGEPAKGCFLARAKAGSCEAAPRAACPEACEGVPSEQSSGVAKLFRRQQVSRVLEQYSLSYARKRAGLARATGCSLKLALRRCRLPLKGRQCVHTFLLFRHLEALVLRLGDPGAPPRRGFPRERVIAAVGSAPSSETDLQRSLSLLKDDQAYTCEKISTPYSVHGDL